MNTPKDVHKCDENLYFTYCRLGIFHRCEHLWRCRKVSITKSMMISQSNMYVGFICYRNRKREEPELVKAPLFFAAHSRYVFLLRLFLEGRTPALPSPLYRSKYFLFQFRVQRYNNYLTYANFSAEKCRNML